MNDIRVISIKRVVMAIGKCKGCKLELSTKDIKFEKIYCPRCGWSLDLQEKHSDQG